MPEPYDMGGLALPPESELPALLDAFPHARPLRFADEEFLVRAGDTGTNFFLLLRGTCVVELPPPEPEEAEDEPPADDRHAGSEVFMLTATPIRPLFVGEMACFGDGLRSASVRSSMNSIAIEFQTSDLHQILEGFPRLTRSLCEQFSERLIDLHGQISRHRRILMMQATQEFIEGSSVLFSAGDPAGKLFQLVDGAVTLTDANGTEEVLRPKGGKPVFIEPLPYFVGGAYQRTATAKGMVIVVAISAKSREAVVRNFPHLTLELLQQAHRETN